MTVFSITNAFCVLCIFVNIYPNYSYNIKQAFEQNEVVPDVVTQAPTQLLKVAYSDALEVYPGGELTPTQVKSEPTVEWEAEPNAYYTLIMTDPDAPSRSEPKFREFKHWLVTNIPGHDVSQGEVLAAYRGSGPPKGTGLHRYVFLLYKQPGKLEFDEERVGNNSSNGRPKFRAAVFVEKYGLGAPVAGNFFQAQWDESVATKH